MLLNETMNHCYSAILTQATIEILSGKQVLMHFFGVWNHLGSKYLSVARL